MTPPAPGVIFNNKGLAETCLQITASRRAATVGRTAGPEGNDDPHRVGRIVLGSHL